MLNQLSEVICEFVEIEKDAIHEGARLIEDLGFNSYDLMSMIGRLEEDFEIEVEEKDVVTLKTVGEVMSYIKTQVA